MYADVVEARVKLKMQGKEPEKLYLSTERYMSLSENIHTTKSTFSDNGRYFGLSKDLTVFFRGSGDERAVAEDGTVEKFRNQIGTPISWHSESL